MEDWYSVSGTVVAGHGVASGRAVDSPYTGGTIALQQPHFLALGLDLSPYFLGTLNVSIAPKSFAFRDPWKRLTQVRWCAEHQPEDFLFAECRIKHSGKDYSGLVYYPSPETKEQHFQAAETFELLLPLIPEIIAGSPVVLRLKRSQMICI